MMVEYGTTVFNKIVGHYGPKAACPNCGKEYQTDFIKSSKWGHFCYIPLIPMGSKYYRVCPVCYASMQMKKKEAKAMMAEYPSEAQELVHVGYVHKKSKTCDLKLEDRISGQEYPILQGASKAEYKKEKKDRLYKKMQETVTED